MGRYLLCVGLLLANLLSATVAAGGDEKSAPSRAIAERSRSKIPSGAEPSARRAGSLTQTVQSVREMPAPSKDEKTQTAGQTSGDDVAALVGAVGDNDECASAIPIGVGTFDFDNSAATTDGPNHTGCTDVNDPVGTVTRDLWYCWTSPCDGAIRLNTCGQTSVDTKVAVYDGCACPTGTDDPIVCTDDGCGVTNQTDMSFEALSGRQYLIRLGSFPGAIGGSGQFTIECPAPSICAEPGTNCQSPDNFNASTSNRTAFVVAEGFTPSQTGDITDLCWWGAYNGGQSGDCQGDAPDTFEIRYYANESGVPGALIAGPFTQGVNLAVAGPVATGGLVADVIPEYEFSATHPPVPVEVGQCYWVEISNSVSAGCFWSWEFGFGGDGRAFQDGEPPNGYGLEDLRANDHAFCANLPLDPISACLPPIPSNDDCAVPNEAIRDGVTFFETTSATTDGPAEPSCQFPLDDDQISADIWYDYVATCSETLTVSLCDSGFDTKLAVYDGETCPPNSPPAACNDDFCFLESQVSLPVVLGRTYKIRVGGFFDPDTGAETGAGRIEITCAAPPPAPPNDNCTDTPIETLALGTPVVYTGSNVNATHECNPLQGDHVWIAFDLLQPGTVTLDYTGTAPAFLAAWAVIARGCPCSSFTPVADCQVASADGNFVLTWDCLSAGIYYFPILTEPGSQGSYRVTASTTPCVSNFAEVCAQATGDCSVDHLGRGCNQQQICETTCELDPFCCCSWDNICVIEAGYVETCLGAQDSCCTDTGAPGCDNLDCCAKVCIQRDNFCCTTTWDDLCTGHAESLCDPLCPECKDGLVELLDPILDGNLEWYDSRRPFADGARGALEGRSSFVVSAPDSADANDGACWSMCETNLNPTLHPGIGATSPGFTVVHNGGTDYTITLDRPITHGEVTTLKYDNASVGGMTVFTATFRYLPGDVNGDGTSTPDDIPALIASLGSVTPLPLDRVDVDRSNEAGSTDILALINLLNGGGDQDVWLNVSIPPGQGCP